MERIARLVGRRTFGQQESGASTPAASQPSDEPILSVLDLGGASVKAVVLATDRDRPIALAFSAEALPPGADDATVLRAAERALVRAEDAAGAVPRRVAVGLSAADCVFAKSAKEARLGLSAERGEAPPLTHLRDGLFALTSAVERGRRVVAALDLDLAGLVPEPDALARLTLNRNGKDAAVVIDVGGETTGVSICLGGDAQAAIDLPIGGGTLEERLRDRLGLSVSAAREAVAAHSAGAGHRSSAGLSAARAIGELARHHADVWLDALETGLAELARGRSLPPALLICGGGAHLPELREALAGGVWHSALPFDAAVTVRVLGASDVVGLELSRGMSYGPEGVTTLCLSVAAARL